MRLRQPHYIYGVDMDEQTERLLLLKRELTAILSNAYDDYHGEGAPIAEIAIEEFGQHFNPGIDRKSNMTSMMKSSCARAVCIVIADNWAANVVAINKGRAPKTEADMLARHYGVSGSAHERDSLHLGLLAGYDKCTDDGYRVSIDPGYEGTGYTVWQRGHPVRGGTIYSSKVALQRDKRKHR